MPDLSPPLQPEDWSELMAGYVLGDLTDAETVLVEAHLAAHPEQQSEIASLMLPLDLFPLTLPPNNPSLALRQRIVEAANTESAVASSPAQPPQVNLLAGGWQKAIAVAGLSLLAGLGWYNFQLHQELAVAKQQLLASQSVVRQELAAAKQDLLAAQSVVSLLQQPNNRLVSLTSAPGKPMGKGSLVMIPDKSTAVLTLQQLAPLPKGQVYRVWAIMGDEEMACADFLPDGDKKVLMQIPLDRWNMVNQVMITIEQKNAKAAEGEIAIEGKLGV